MNKVSSICDRLYSNSGSKISLTKMQQCQRNEDVMSLRKLQSFSSLCDESAKQHSEWVSQACSVAKIQKVAKQAFIKREMGVRVPDEYA